MNIFKFEIQKVKDGEVVDSEILYIEAENKREAKSLHYHQMRLKFHGEEKRLFIDGERELFDDSPRL